MSNHRMRHRLNRGGNDLEQRLYALFQPLPFQLCELFVLDDNTSDDRTARFHCRYFMLKAENGEDVGYGKCHKNPMLNIIDPGDKAAWSSLHTIFEVTALPIPDVWQANQLSFSVYAEGLKEENTNFRQITTEYNTVLVRDPTKRLPGILDLTLVRVPESDGSVAGVVRLFNQFKRRSGRSHTGALAYADVVFGRWMEFFSTDVSGDVEELPDPNRPSVRLPIRTRSTKFKDSLKFIRMAAISDRTVLIEGDTGTGKEEIAHYIHRNSSRSGKPFVSVNCGAIMPTLFESEMFGYVKNAFNGADRDKEGLFKAADSGIIFLDEIGDIQPDLQVKLLRAIQEKEIRPVGDTKNHAIDVRIVAATNRRLVDSIKEGKFREDLYYRLNKIRITLPSLHERREDILDLIDGIIDDLRRQPDSRVPEFSLEVKLLLSERRWPGNLRELYTAVHNLAELYQLDGVVPVGALINIGQGYGLTDLGASMRAVLAVANDASINGPLLGLSISEIVKAITIGIAVELEGDMTKAVHKLGIQWNTVKKYNTMYQTLQHYMQSENRI